MATNWQTVYAPCAVTGHEELYLTNGQDYFTLSVLCSLLSNNAWRKKYPHHLRVFEAAKVMLEHGEVGAVIVDLFD